MLMDRPVISPKLMRISSFVLAVLLLVMSPLPVLAYSPVATSKWNFPVNDYNSNMEMYYLTPEQANLFALNTYDPFLELGTEHNIFLDDNNIPNVIWETTDQNERASCNHAWNNGLIYTHTKNNDGSCTVNAYVDQQCSNCNTSILGDLFSSTQYPKCPH